MKFKPPGGILNILSVLWVLVGIGCFWLSFERGAGIAVLGLISAVPAVLLWFGSYRAANFLIILFIGGILLAVTLMILSDSDWTARFRRVGKICFSCYCIYELWKWSDKKNPNHKG